MVFNTVRYSVLRGASGGVRADAKGKRQRNRPDTLPGTIHGKAGPWGLLANASADRARSDPAVPVAASALFDWSRYFFPKDDSALSAIVASVTPKSYNDHARDRVMRDCTQVVYTG